MAKKDHPEYYKPMHLDLVAASKKGDQSAQFELYKLYNDAMFNTALRILGNSDDAEDVMQEAFLKAFFKLDSYRAEVSFGAWLKKIVVNRSLDFLRTRREHLALDEVGEPEPEEDGEEVMLKHSCSAEEIRRAIESLPEGYRIVLSLILLEGYDHEEVSQILNISNATSRTQYHRAKKKLVQLLKEEDTGND